MKKLVFVLSVILCAGSLFGQYTGKIIRVYDGETFWIEMENGDIDSIRLYGIDCPELDQQFGVAAKSQLESHLHRKVELVNKTRDRNNYMMAYVYYDTRSEKGINLNHQMVENGYAWKAQFTKDKDLEKLEKQARKNRAGLWKNEDPVAPWEWRKKHKN